MAEAPNSFFSQKAVDKMRSPDDLDKYLKVTNPGPWAVLCAGAALIIGLLAWGVFGTVVSTVSAYSVKVQGEVVCFLNSEDVAHVDVGDIAMVGGVKMKVSSVSKIPISKEEVKGMVSLDYLADNLAKDKWSYVVRFEGDSSSFEDGMMQSTAITAESVSPISLVLGGGR